MAQIFISYKREDRARAKVLATALIAKGYDVWWDVELLPGQDFYDEINNVIKNAKATIVLWSDRAVESRPVRSEAALANSIETLIPARIDNVMPPLPFNALHTIELTGWKGDETNSEFQNLLQAIDLKVGAPAKAERSESLVEDEIEVAEDTWKIVWSSVRDLQPESAIEYKHFISKYRETADAEIISLAERRIEHLSRRKPIDGLRWLGGAIVGAVALIATVLQIHSTFNNPEPDAVQIVKDIPEVVETVTIDQDNEAFEKAKNDGRVRAYGSYVKAWAEGKYLKEADAGAWASAERQNSILAYKAYLKYFPQGENIDGAIMRLEQAEKEAKRKEVDTWASIIIENLTVLSLKDFVKAYPSSPYTEIATNLIEVMEAPQERPDSCKEKLRQDTINYSLGTSISQNTRNSVLRLMDAGQFCDVTNIYIIGYTDANGNEDAELAESKRFATDVLNELIRQGVNRNVIFVQGRGSSGSSANYENDAQRVLDRRAEVYILLGSI